MQIFTYIFIITLITAPAPAEQPLEALQRGIDKGISVLEDPQYQDDSNKNRTSTKTLGGHPGNF